MVDMNLWANYLSGRGVSADKITKLRTGSGKADDVDDKTEGAQAVNLEDGLDTAELALLGVKSSTIDCVIDDGWTLKGDAGKARSTGALKIEDTDLIAAEAGMKAWGESHGFTLDEARAMYYADPGAVHEEKSEAVTTARGIAKQVLEGDGGLWKEYDTWKADDTNTETDKSFKNFLIKKHSVKADFLGWLDVKAPESAEALLKLAYISTLSDKVQTAYGLKSPITAKYTPKGDGIYDAKEIGYWVGAEIRPTVVADVAARPDPTVATIPKKVWAEVKDGLTAANLVEADNAITPASGFAWAYPEDAADFATVLIDDINTNVAPKGKPEEVAAEKLWSIGDYSPIQATTVKTSGVPYTYTARQIVETLSTLNNGTALAVLTITSGSETYNITMRGDQLYINVKDGDPPANLNDLLVTVLGEDKAANKNWKTLLAAVAGVGTQHSVTVDGVERIFILRTQETSESVSGE